MNLELSSEQRQFGDSVERVLSESCSFEQRQKALSAPPGWSRETWKKLCGLGTSAALVPEEFGGLGGTMIDLLPVLHACGRFLAIDPLVSSAIVATTALRASGARRDCEELLPAAATGESILAFSHDEATRISGSSMITTAARKVPGGWQLDGVKANVIHADSADHFLVTARIASGERADGLFLVPADAEHVTIRRYSLYDDTPAGSVSFTQCPARLVASGPEAESAIQGAIAAGMAAHCAQAAGTAEAAYALTLEYIKTRRQFGRAIGENQVLRHRAAEMLVALETIRSMARLAVISFGDLPRSIPADLRRAKLVIGRQGRALCEAAVQLHGGIGMTEEYAVGHCFRRMTLFDELFGNSDVQAGILAAERMGALAGKA